jgi:hypothetical protein
MVSFNEDQIALAYFAILSDPYLTEQALRYCKGSIFAECSEEESFSRNRGITNGSKTGVEENACIRVLDSIRAVK